MKLYKYTIDESEIVHPSSWDGTVAVKISWLGDGFVAMDDGWKALMVASNADTFTLCDADDVATAKDLSKSYWNGRKADAIRQKYNESEELRALRVDDTVVKNDIASIIDEINTERDAYYAIA